MTAPLFVRSGTGINDDLNGTERAVRFAVPALGGADVEIVHSLAKWKRIQLGAYGIPAGFGLYTDMNAVRADEELDNIHSIYVDQWDWERTIRAEDRNLEFLKGIVRRIYSVIRSQERRVYETYRHITPVLPEEIVFVQSEELLREFPHRTPAERETEAARRYGAIFVIGIGGKLSDGKKHDGRAPDYDDWTTPTPGGYCGLNGDIVVWNPVLERAYEISSMGIRVDREAPAASARSGRVPRAGRTGVSPGAARRAHPALCGWRHRPVASVHVPATLCPYRGSTGEPVARPDEDRMHEIRHFPQIK